MFACCGYLQRVRVRQRLCRVASGRWTIDARNLDVSSVSVVLEHVHSHLLSHLNRASARAAETHGLAARESWEDVLASLSRGDDVITEQDLFVYIHSLPLSTEEYRVLCEAVEGVRRSSRVVEAPADGETRSST